MVLDAEHFQKIFTRAYEKNDLKEIDDEYFDMSMVPKGITVIYRDSRYKKKIRLLANTSLIVDNLSDTDMLIRKLEKRIGKYFNYKYKLDDFTLSGVNLVSDINVGTRANISNYLKVLQRVSRVKGFSPTHYDGLDEKNSFCLSGNSNAINFLLYDLERSVIDQLQSADAGWKEIQSAGMKTRGILRAEVRLNKPKAIRAYTDARNIAEQIIELSKKCQDVFLDTFIRIVPFGDFYKKNAATEIIRREVTDSIMRRRMLNLLTLIPEKKSLHLAQKAMNCRDVGKVMKVFGKINLAPVTISKRQDIKHLGNLYSYFADS